MERSCWGGGVSCEYTWNKKPPTQKLWFHLIGFLVITLGISLFSNVQYGGIVMGTLFGLVSGGVIAQRLDIPQVRLIVVEGIVVVTVGSIGLYAIYLIVNPIAYLGEGSLFFALSIIGIWISVGGPFLANKIKLAMKL